MEKTNSVSRFKEIYCTKECLEKYGDLFSPDTNWTARQISTSGCLKEDITKFIESMVGVINAILSIKDKKVVIYMEKDIRNKLREQYKLDYEYYKNMVCEKLSEYLNKTQNIKSDKYLIASDVEFIVCG